MDDVAAATAEFVGLYADVYDRCYPRRSPREPALSTEGLMLLRHLEGAGPLTVQEAAAHFDRSQAATSEMIERLVRRELLERLVDQRDRRRHLVWLTEAGLAAVAAARRPLADDLLGAAMARLSREERATLLASMRRLVDAAAPATPRHRGDPP